MKPNPFRSRKDRKPKLTIDDLIRRETELLNKVNNGTLVSYGQVQNSSESKRLKLQLLRSMRQAIQPR